MLYSDRIRYASTLASLHTTDVLCYLTDDRFTLEHSTAENYADANVRYQMSLATYHMKLLLDECNRAPVIESVIATLYCHINNLVLNGA